MHHVRGPNLWTWVPVTEVWVDLGILEDHPSDTIPGYYERLVEWLPGLIEHRCSVGERGGFLQRVQRGTWAGHVMEHVSLELQTLAGIDDKFFGFGRAREISERGVYKVVISTPDAIIGKTLDGRITSWNEAAERLFGYSATEAIGQQVQMLLPADRLDEEMRILGDLALGRLIDRKSTRLNSSH